MLCLIFESIKLFLLGLSDCDCVEECIPVGCVPPALYRKGGCLRDKDPSSLTETPPPPNRDPPGHVTCDKTVTHL